MEADNCVGALAKVERNVPDNAYSKILRATPRVPPAQVDSIVIVQLEIVIFHISIATFHISCEVR